MCLIKQQKSIQLFLSGSFLYMKVPVNMGAVTGPAKDKAGENVARRSQKGRVSGTPLSHDNLINLVCH